MQSLLLAGGKSSRMGIDKAMIEVDGHSMISRVVKALTLAGLEPIRIAVANPEDIEKYGSVSRPGRRCRMGFGCQNSRWSD